MQVNGPGMKSDINENRFLKEKEVAKMKKLLEKFETAMAAVAFAEAGEFDTARRILEEDKPRKTDRPSIYKHQRVAQRKEVRAD